MICSKCGKQNPENNAFCCGCGLKLEVGMHCASCGSDLRSGDAFCGKCGTAANKTIDEHTHHMPPDSEVKPEPTVVIAPVPTPEPEPAPEPEPVPTPTPPPAEHHAQQNHHINPANSQYTNYRQPQVQPNYVSGNQPHPYRRLGGFLAWIAYGQPIGAVILILSEFAGLAFLFRLFSDRGFDLSILGGAFVLPLLITLGLYVFYLIFAFRFCSMIRNRNSRFFRLFENTMIFFFVLNVIVVIASPWHGIADIIGYTIGVVIVFVLWALYFSKSVRVHIYFGSEKFRRRSIFLKNTRPPRVH